MTIEKMSTPETTKKYQKKAIINGINISVGWDSDYNYYTVYLPQIEPGKISYEQGISDQTIKLSKKDDIAKQVFEYTTKLAETESNVYKLYKKIEEYIRNLSCDDDEE